MVVKVSRDVAEALDSLRESVSNESILDTQTRHKCLGLGSAGKHWHTIETLKSYELAKILINGYELEETPEENLLKFYNKCDWFSKDGTECQTIRITLDKLNIKIKGIND